MVQSRVVLFDVVQNVVLCAGIGCGLLLCGVRGVNNLEQSRDRGSYSGLHHTGVASLRAAVWDNLATLLYFHFHLCDVKH